MSQTNHTAKFLVAGSLIAGALFGLQGATNAASLHYKVLGSGADVRTELMGSGAHMSLEGTCGAGKTDTTKSKDHKCAAKKDSKGKAKGKDGKCGQGKCGGN
jgi:uncharacterized low-complexity protein